MNSDVTLSLAPLRGITTATYRRAFAQCAGGVDCAVAPFIPTAPGTSVKAGRLKDIAREHNPATIPVVPQVIGRDTEQILVLARAVEALGFTELNWNLGCPWPMIVKRRRGSALLREPAHVRRTVERIVAETGIACSLKVRLGIQEPTELPAFLAGLGDAPVREIVIHPRTAEQMYGGRPLLEHLPRCIEAARAPLGYSGDIRTLADFQHIRRAFPVFRHIMLGRALIADPTLALRLRGRDSVSASATWRAMHDRLLDDYARELYGARPLLGRMKELWTYTAQGYIHPPDALTRILRSLDVAGYTAAVDRFFFESTWRGLTPGLDVGPA